MAMEQLATGEKEKGLGDGMKILSPIHLVFLLAQLKYLLSLVKALEQSAKVDLKLYTDKLLLKRNLRINRNSDY